MGISIKISSTLTQEELNNINTGLNDLELNKVEVATYDANNILINNELEAKIGILDFDILKFEKAGNIARTVTLNTFNSTNTNCNVIRNSNYICEMYGVSINMYQLTSSSNTPVTIKFYSYSNNTLRTFGQGTLLYTITYNTPIDNFYFGDFKDLETSPILIDSNSKIFADLEYVANNAWTIKDVDVKVFVKYKKIV